MARKIVGVFNTEQDAVGAIEELKQQGIQADDISVVSKNSADMNALDDRTGTKAPEGVATGAATGGVVGGVTGLLAGLGLLAIPGIGPIIAAGPIAAALTGAAVGAGAGGLAGGLIGMGIPEDEANEYDAYVNDGRILVMVDEDVAVRENVYRVFRKYHTLNSNYYSMGESYMTERKDSQHGVQKNADTYYGDQNAAAKRKETREPAGTFYQEVTRTDHDMAKGLNGDTDGYDREDMELPGRVRDGRLRRSTNDPNTDL
ncbi:hypothetical protein DCC85_06695 [Paenibacillus sp. CAA11]|uniref:general stress protein n=1 Tax=Paenibacillus sp. CAA11 TaxID=1532905 RepID=UPI000D3C8E3A|nr:general stress protein [Paenibacillus sp. CAA11]AWB43939.1 hypothetical protein DCC85_06695 [Paenibacillus sp. CAA11]